VADAKTAVVALGGNAITRNGVPDTIANQFRHTRESLGGVVELAAQAWKLALTHGNGPQVGNAILRVELTRGRAPELPLGICVADTEGGMGYMIEQSLQNALAHAGVRRNVATIVTQVLVDEHDPAVENPTKYIGQFYTESDARQLAAANGWTVKEDPGRGWRRVVPSPTPLSIVEAETIKALVAQGTIAIGCGGGGIPVFRMRDGRLEGMDAVIDKDLASAVLAHEIHADLLLILTGVDHVALNYTSEHPTRLEFLSAAEAERYLREGQFPKGSMGPKIQAALNFLRSGGKEVIITSIPRALDAVHGHAGTRIAA
jgi:carbamate kinase